MWSVLLVLQLLYAVSDEQYTFSDHKKRFNHLAVDYKTGAVYVGAVNKIYQLTPDLKIVRHAITGPVYDSISDSLGRSSNATKLTNNFNKVLVIDHEHDRLISCGTALQGMCSVLSLNDINIRRDVPKALVANNPTASTVAFVVPGPPDPKTSQVLYIGVTFTGSFPHRYNIPAVSSLSLEEHRLFDLAKIFCEFCHSDKVTGTRLYINTMYRDRHIVNYVYGFSSGEFSYFLTTQKGTNGEIYSKIIRICHSDEQYYSYTEIPLSCKANENNGTDYNLVEAAYVTKSTNVSENLGVFKDEDVLYALFHTEGKQPLSVQKRSALCLYTIRDINKKFGANIDRCFRGEGMRGLEFIWPNRECVYSEYKIEGAHFCGMNFNAPLGGEIPIVSEPLLEFKETLTSISATTASNYSIVVFAGTIEGHIKKIVLKNPSAAVEYADIVVDKGSPVNKDLSFDTQRKHLYVITLRKVSRIEIYNCSQHTSCSTCITYKDPFCGWCVIKNKCSTQSECYSDFTSLDPLFWVQNHKVQCNIETLTNSQNMSIFTVPEITFNHLTVDQKTGHVYLGAVNRIYQLSPDLEVAQWIVTGPVNDSALCELDCPSEYVKEPTDNVNKVLLIDYATSRLITCGSVLHGLCSVRNLNNISHNVHEVRELVVANDATASTVAFIAPGPPNPPVTQVMYVGVTFTNNSPYSSEIPAVSSRSLKDDNLFNLVHEAFPFGTRMFVSSLSRERYPINYVYGFSSEGFSYFLTTQLRGVGSDTYYSKLVRVCHNDENYYSYTEIPISCSGEEGSLFRYNLIQAAFVGKPGAELAEDLGITAQEDVLFAAFSQSESINTNTPSDRSALCVYSLKAIRHKFLQNIQNCFSGNGYHGLDFISPSHFCTATKIDFISEDFCGLNVNTPIGGDQPVETVPVAVFTKRLTAVAATATGDYTVVFAGTAQGHLKKIVVESATSAFEYGDIVVDEGSPVNKDLFFDNQLKHLYVMTERKVSKVKIQECRVYDSCLKCLGTNVPYCGWCYQENKCSLRSNCHDFSNDSLYISYRSGRCTTIAKVTPDQLQLSSTQTLNLYLEDLPPLDRNFLCKFTVFDLSLTTNATLKSYGVTCTTPSPRSLPPIPAGQHHVTAKLTVHSAQGIDFVATNFTFFDCNTYSSCTQCVSSSFPCNWCLDAHRCTHDPEENCRNDIVITGVSRKGPSYRSGPGFCPSILTSDGTKEILVPDGAKMVIKVKFHIIGQFIVQPRFVCQFNIEGRVTHVNTKLSDDTIYCEAVEFTYKSHAPNTTASFAVIWGGSKPIDNPSDIHILIYRCNTMAKNNCSKCLALPEKFGCGWCQGSDKCEVQGQCDAPSIWLNRTQTCK